MHHFAYRNGVLHAEDVPVPEIAAAVGTPVYIYSTATLARMQLARSRHSGGVNAAMCDGSVRFVRDAVNSAAWRAAG